MQHHFEFFILGDELTPEHWLQFYDAVSGYGGLFGKFELLFSCVDNVVRFFVSSNQDLSSLSNNLEGIVLRPVPAEELKLPAAAHKERFVQFVTGGNLLDLREKYAVKGGKSLQYAHFRVRRIKDHKAIIKASLYFKNAGGAWSIGKKTITAFPMNLFAINFANNTRYLKKTVPKYLNIEKSLPMLVSDKPGALFEIDTFPYFSHNYYLGLANYEFDKHSFIIGASGSGKSKFISLFIDRLYNSGMKLNYRVVVIDPHAAMADDFGHLGETRVINFSSQSTELFAGTTTDITAATELTSTLFKSLLGEQFNPKSERLLRFSLFVLFTAQSMTFDNLKRFLLDVELRNQILEHVSGYVPKNISLFFGSDFNELRTKYYNETIAPVVALVDELQLQPTLVGEGELSLNKTIQDNFLTVFSLNKVSMGEKVVKTVAGLLIQQIFLLAQARAFNEKVILVIDEVSVIQNPALAQILAEARKFNLSVILTQQYFGQIEKDLRDAIFSNVFNYYAFKVSEEDARALEGNLNIELPKELVEAEHGKGLKESDIRVKIMTELHPRECLVRVVANGQVVPAVKGRTVDAPSTKLAAVRDKDLQAVKQAPAKLPAKFEEKAQAIVAELDIPPLAGQPARRGLSFNLSELLAEHSSSRLKVRKDKEKE